MILGVTEFSSVVTDLVTVDKDISPFSKVEVIQNSQNSQSFF